MIAEMKRRWRRLRARLRAVAWFWDESGQLNALELKNLPLFWRSAINHLTVLRMNRILLVGDVPEPQRTMLETISEAARAGALAELVTANNQKKWDFAVVVEEAFRRCSEAGKKIGVEFEPPTGEPEPATPGKGRTH